MIGFDHLSDLKALPQWVNWKYEDKGGRCTKIPKNPRTGGNAQSNNPATWAGYELAEQQAAKYDGIGFMFSNGICGIDIDNKEKDSKTEVQAQAVIRLMDTYTEISPSGTGYHLIFKCDLSAIPTANGKLTADYYQKNPYNSMECYFSGLTNRFFTFTDKPINIRDIEDRTDKVLVFLDRYMRKAQPDKTVRQPEILAVIRKAKNASKFISLFDNGDTSAYNNDDNAADQALCNILAFYTRGDIDEIDRLFRQSALYREKWNRDDYRNGTINKAILLCNGRFYKSGRSVSSLLSPDTQAEYITIENLAGYLREQGIQLSYNVIHRAADISGLDPKYSPEHAADILPAILHNKLKFIYEKCPKGDIMDYLSVIAAMNSYNPVLDMLTSVVWDGKDRLPELFSILSIPGGDKLSRTLVYKWLWQCLSMARNELKGAYGADGLLVLQGRQGVGKTSFVRKIAVRQELCYVGKSLNFQDKDTLRRCGSNWIVELGEIETTFKSDKEKLKSYITDETDLYRLPYGRADVHLARRASFIGTCNSTQYLIDETGNRRFWTVPVEHIDLDALARFDALQLWLQVDRAATHNRQGFRLTKDEQATLAERNGRHEKPLISELEVRDLLIMAEREIKDMAYKKITVTEFKLAHDALKAYSVQQISQALNKIGIPEATVEKVNGKTQRLRLLPVWGGKDCGD